MSANVLADIVREIRQDQQPGILMPIQPGHQLRARVVEHHEIQSIGSPVRERIYMVEVRSTVYVTSKEAEETAARLVEEKEMGTTCGTRPYPERTGEPMIDGLVMLRDMGEDMRKGLDPDAMRVYRQDLRWWDEAFEAATGVNVLEELEDG